MPDNSIPRPGMLATVRNRRGVIAAVNPFDGESGRLHLVHVEYKDDLSPDEERLLWELEPQRNLLEPNALPDVHSSEPMPPEDFDALLRAARWTALSPYLDPDGEGPLERQPIASPFHGGVCVEDYQLVPLLKALRMPRVSLLIADDVGLGKTIEAGLVLTEMLLRRRIQRVLILTPASLCRQWKEELWDKFSLDFEVVTRKETERLYRRLGMDANPWRSFSRIIASYHYLRQPDILEQFLATCHTPDNSPHLPWDLLIVDECHNLMPSPFGEDSGLCRMLGSVAPQFEHKLFLSATPHNGHTRSFTGLLELLDPVRFTRTSELKPAERQRVQDIVVRRLKREINTAGDSPRFCNRRAPQAVTLNPDASEKNLSNAFNIFRRKVRAHIAGRISSRRRAGTFAVEILGKRLLSCPSAFAESWRRTKQGFSDENAASEAEMTAAENTLRQETGDDREIQQREATAATVVGAWLKNLADEVSEEIYAVERALDDLGFDLEGDSIIEQTPLADTRFDALISLIENLLMADGKFRNDERLVVFTEYKTTLDYLTRHLRERYAAKYVLTLFGGSGSEGMDDADRENVKVAFNNPEASVRILVATDAASEGLNLHRTARYLLHYDCPWNPSRLEQRNGRLDRYGQSREVSVHHFISEMDEDLQFLDHVVRKANEIREDLGSMNEVFDQAVHRRLILGEDLVAVKKDLDHGINSAQERAVIDADSSATLQGANGRDVAALSALAAEIDLDENALSQTLETALAIPAGRPQLQVAEEPGVYRILRPDLQGWRGVIDETVRLKGADNAIGTLPKIAFGIEPFIEQLGDLSLFSPRRDVLLMHLAHPFMLRALTVLTRYRYPGTGMEKSRWTVRRGGVPPDADALVLLSIEELAVNELRETFHRWVRTLTLPVYNSELGYPLPHTPASELRDAQDTPPSDWMRARELLEDVEVGIRQLLNQRKQELTRTLHDQLEIDGKQARDQEDKRYQQRQGEVSELIEQTTSARLEREIERLQRERSQMSLFDEENRIAGITQSIEQIQAELNQRRHHYEVIRQQLGRERKRILEHLLPARFALAGNAQVFPVTLEIRLPEQDI